MNKNLEKLTIENIVARDMTDEQINELLEIISSIKEFNTTLFPVNNSHEAYLLQITFEKVFDDIRGNGLYIVENEGRILDSYIKKVDDGYTVSSHITRLMYKGENKEYDVVDEITSFAVKTKYNFIYKEFIESKKGKVR